MQERLKGVLYQVEHPSVLWEYNFVPPLGDWDDWLNMRMQHPDAAKIWHELRRPPVGADENAVRLLGGMK